MALRLYEWQLEVEPLVLVDAEVKPFVERLVDDIHAAGWATKAVNLFYNELPEIDETPCMVVRDMGGIPSVNPFPQIQVLFQVRGGTWEEAREFASHIYNHFHGATGKYLTGYRILSALADGLPASMGEDENQRHLIGWNMTFRAASTNQLTESVGYGGTRDPNEP